MFCFVFVFGLFFLFNNPISSSICKLPIRSEIYNCTFKNTNKVSVMGGWSSTFCDWLRTTCSRDDTWLPARIVYLGEYRGHSRYRVSQKGKNLHSLCTDVPPSIFFWGRGDICTQAKICSVTVFPCRRLPSWWYATWCHMSCHFPWVPRCILKVLCHVSVSLCYFSFCSFRKHRHKSPAVYILSPALDGLWRENRGSVNRLLLSSCFKMALTGRKGVACSRLSDSGEDTKVKGTRKVGSFLPFYFRRAFSIQQARLSRSPEQVRKAVAMYSKCEHNSILCQHPGTGSWTPSVDSP